MKLISRQRRLEKADAEIGRQFGQMPGVLVDALIGIDADLAGAGETKGAPRLQPLVHEIVDEALPQLELGHLIEPALSDIEDQQSRRR